MKSFVCVDKYTKYIFIHLKSRIKQTKLSTDINNSGILFLRNWRYMCALLVDLSSSCS
jgi:hypothetical protein